VCLVHLPNKAGIVELEETVVARVRLGKHVAAVTNIRATKLWDAVFSMRSVSSDSM
jgi:hypothetical protein